MHKLSDREQALLMLLVFILPPVITWAGLGMPTDKASLGILLSAILSGILVFVKELLGGAPPKVPEDDPPNDDNPGINERVAVLETDMKWVKRILGKIDRRMWWVLGSVVTLGLIAILVALYG